MKKCPACCNYFPLEQNTIFCKFSCNKIYEKKLKTIYYLNEMKIKYLTILYIETQKNILQLKN